jgi:hypothetical protein
MADVQVAIRNYLLTRTDVTDIVGQRIYTDKLPQKATLPALTMRIQSESHEHALRGLVGIVATRIQFEAYASTRLVTNELCEAVFWSGIDAIKGTYSGLDIRGVMVEDGRRSFEDDDTAGGDDARYVSQFDLTIHWVKGA